MIFCPPRDVNEIWAVVAKATASNELGIAAKVAPVPESGDTRKERLICVYTADFKDKADVARVVRKLRELQLIGTRSSIYYKPGEIGPVVTSRAYELTITRCLHIHRHLIRKPMGDQAVSIQFTGNAPLMEPSMPRVGKREWGRMNDMSIIVVVYRFIVSLPEGLLPTRHLRDPEASRRPSHA